MINNQTLEELDWFRILELWKNEASSEPGKKYIENMTFASREESALRRDIISDIVNARRMGAFFSVDTLEDISEIMKRLHFGGVVSTQNLITVMKQISTVHSVMDSVRKSGGKFLSEFVRDLEPMDDLYDLLQETLEEDGTIKNNASPELYGLRTRKSILYKDAVNAVDRIGKRPNIAKYLQDDFFTHRNEKTVLPVKSEFRSMVKGVIQGVSNTGLTVFVEPHEMVEMNNRIKEIESEIEIEEYRICAMLAESVSQQREVLLENQKILAGLDAFRGAANLGKSLQCDAWSWSDRDFIRLVSARHPLLVASGIEVIPNTIEMNCRSIMIITGPNAGGKTVTIKTVGICLLMASMGLHIPAVEGSEIPYFESVYTVIGDGQNITSHKSTFSAHIERLRNILSTCSSKDLVLIDEIAAGTSPSHGSVLAQAVIEHIKSRQATAFITTHYSALKAMAHIDDVYQNASVGGEALTPDFRLTPGIPGTSDGIALAQKMGLDKAIIRRARELAGEGDLQFDNLLADLRKSRDELALKLSQQKVLLAEVEAKLEDIRKLETEKKKEIEKIRKEGFTDVAAEAIRLKRILGHLEEKLKKGENDRQTRRQIIVSVDKVLEKTDSEMDKWYGESVPEDEIIEGRYFLCRSLGQKVKILGKKGKGRVRVDISGFPTEVATGDLYHLESDEPPAPKKEMKKSPAPLKEAPSDVEQTVVKENIAVITPSNTLDLRGTRVDQAISELDRFLDRMMMANEDSCAVIHGFGTGALRNSLRSELKNSPYVRMFRPGEPPEGGDGVTIIFMN